MAIREITSEERAAEREAKDRENQEWTEKTLSGTTIYLDGYIPVDNPGYPLEAKLCGIVRMRGQWPVELTVRGYTEQEIADHIEKFLEHILWEPEDRE